MVTCTRCQTTGFLNSEQIPEDIYEKDHDEILKWMTQADDHSVVHDVEVCDCCGNGTIWYGEPGSHYGNDDPIGRSGVYGYNGGQCECH